MVASSLVLFGEARDVMALTMGGTIVFIIGGVFAVWGGLHIPPPRWFIPPWLRPVIAEEKEEVRQLRAERRQRRDRKRRGMTTEPPIDEPYSTTETTPGAATADSSSGTTDWDGLEPAALVVATLRDVLALRDPSALRITDEHSR